MVAMTRELDRSETSRYRSVLPRLTSKVFWDLAIWMSGFGLLIGVLFPFGAIVLGVRSTVSLRPAFFLGAVAAGLLVGAFNFFLAHSIVGVRVRRLAERMSRVGAALSEAEVTGDWSRCSAQSCQLEVDSEDELGQAASAFNWLLESLARARAAEETINLVNRSITEHLDFDALVSTVLSHFIAEVHAQAGAVVVIRDGLMELAEVRNFSDVATLHNLAFIQDAIVRDEITEVVVPKDLFVDVSLLTFRPRSLLVVPIYIGGQAIGAVVLALAELPSRTELRLLRAFQPATSVALNNALTHERFQRLAAIDPLTEAYNRRFGVNRLLEEFSRSLRNATPLGVLSFDIDRFKRVNDNFGHLAGDRVLKAVVATVRSDLREGDVLIRTGGEEFVILIPGAGVRDVETLGERIRNSVELSRIDVGGAELQVTVSLGGLAYYGSGVDEAEKLLSKVDEALYISKQSGRNRLTMTSIPVSPYE